MITTNPQILDQVTQEFLTALKNDGLIIQGAASGLFYYLVIIQLALTSIWMVLSGEPLSRFLANLVKLSFSFGFFMP
jgi:hypothetical protein